VSIRNQADPPRILQGHDGHSIRQEFYDLQGIHPRFVHGQAPMKMRAGDPPCGAHFAEHGP